MHTPRRSSSMNQCVDEMAPSPANDTYFVKHPLHPGVSCCKSGKWVAKICHPIRKVWVCVGIYSNPEEAEDAYTTKKMEYESHSEQETDTFFHTNVADLEKQYPGIYRRPSGKWRAAIVHNKVNVPLGSYNTPKEAAYAYHMSKLELDPHGPRHAHPLEKAKKVNLGSFDTAEEAYNNKRRESDLISPGHKKHNESKASCKADAVAEGKNDSNCVSGDPPVSSRDHLGTFTQEAEDAYNKRMYEFELMVHANNKASCEPNAIVEGKSDSTNGSLVIKVNREEETRGSLTNMSKLELDSQEIGSSRKAGDEQSEKHQRLRNVYPRKSGRWQTEIVHPITKARIYLGTFETAEEAREAYDRKKRELDLMVCDHNKEGKQSNNSCEAATTAKGKSDSTCVSCVSGGPSVSTRVHLGTCTDKAEEAYNNTMREFDLMVCAHKKRKQLEASCKADCSSDSTLVSGDPPVKTRDHLEAENAYTNSMREFDLMVHADKKRKQSNAGCEADAIAEGKIDSTRVSGDPLVSTGDHLGTYAQEAEDAYNKTMSEFELMIRADNKASCEANAIVEDKSDSTNGSSVTNVNVESLPFFGTEERVEFDSGIIDSYGRLIGEYSRLDDELWICRSEDDATLERDEGQKC